MPEIKLEHITKRWGKFYAVEDLNLTIADNSFVTLLGPSGCGKTTTLRMIAGLETPTSGRITIGDQVVFDSAMGINVPANKRRVGFLFQNYALWPNMTVYENISFGLTNVKEDLPKIDFDTRVNARLAEILSAPGEVTKVLAECRDKKGKLDDKKALLKLIDTFTISQFTAKKLLGYHLEDGKDVSAEAAALREKAEAARKALEATGGSYDADYAIYKDGQPVTEVRKLTKEEIDLTVRRVARIVKIGMFMDRYPAEPEPEEPVYEPFATIELPAQDPVPAEIPYDGVTLYGFPAVRTEIVRSGEADLDTDGAMETVQLLRIWDQYDQQSFILRIQKGTEVFDTGMDEGELSYPPSFNARIWLADLDADACPEIYFCGDMASDDYVLNAWSCKSGTPEQIPFEDQLFLEASILSISEGSLQLESTQDVLGSYEAVRAYVLHDGVLVPLGDAWQIVPANTSYSRLSLVRDLPVTLDDGTESTFGPGTILQVTGTDGKSFVDVVTEDGTAGRVYIEKPEGDWQWYINGEPELSYFELVPYAG